MDRGNQGAIVFVAYLMMVDLIALISGNVVILFEGIVVFVLNVIIVGLFFAVYEIVNWGFFVFYQGLVFCFDCV